MTAPAISWPDRSAWTLPELVRRRAAELGEAEFLTTEDDTLSFAELERRSTAVASALAGFGVQPGDRVLALAGNSTEFVVAMVAAHKRQAVFTPINTELTGAFLEHQVRNSAPRVVLVDAGLVAAFDAVDTAEAGIEHTVVIGGAVPDKADRPSCLAGTRWHHWDALLAVAPIEPLPSGPSDVCTIMYTSGTTGPAKGVLLPQAHCVLFTKTLAEAVQLDHTDRYFCAMPLFHANGLFMQLFACLWAGCPLTMVKRFSAGGWLEQVRACGATITNALGVMPEFIFRQPPTTGDRDHRLTRVLAIPIGPDWGAAFEERFGVRLVQGYGMTEVNMVAYSDPADGDGWLAGCAGRVLSEYFDVRIADPETDEPLPVGAAGEILVRPRHPYCFNQGYFRMADKTVEAWRNLWFHTGDAGRFDERGRLHFIDRLNDRIRRRGENISSYEIEQVLNEHPAVLESAAVGVKVEAAGGEEEIKAVVVLHAGAELEPADLLRYCVEHMPRFAVPRYVEVVSQLDKTASGKIRKAALRADGVTAATWDRVAAGIELPRR